RDAAVPETNRRRGAVAASSRGSFRGWLPELDAIAFRIGDPRELSVVVLFALRIDRHALGCQRLEQRVEIVDAVVEHERLRRRAEVARVAWKDRPDGDAVLVARAVKRRGRRIVAPDAEVRLVPRVQFFRIARLEEHAAEADDTPLHAAYRNRGRRSPGTSVPLSSEGTEVPSDLRRLY